MNDLSQDFAPPSPPAVGATLSMMELMQVAVTVRTKSGLAGIKALYDSWIERNPDDALLYAVLFNYSVSLSELGDLPGAQACLQRAIGIKPDFIPAYINLGRLYERQGILDQAVLQWTLVTGALANVTESTISHKVTALNQTARVLEERHQDQPAETMLRQSIELDRDQPEALQHYLALRQRQCKWPIVQPWEKQTREMLTSSLSPLSIAAHSDDPLYQLALAWRHNKRDIPVEPSGVLASHWAALEEKDGRLRVGYLSSDIRGHAVGYLMAEVFELHDRNKFEIFVYYSGPDFEDPLQRRAKSSIDHWVSLAGLDDKAAARRIADDGIQILIDLNGYTKDARTKALALRPAPVIANWLGYPGTMASPYHHYIIADDWIIPPEHEIYYSEAVRRLPCYQPNDRKRIVSSRDITRTEAGLPDEAMVYCCFNAPHKITRFTFQRWLTILSRVPGSVLWLLSSVPTTEQRLRDAAQEGGIDPDRIIFAPKMANPDHLARYQLADLFLDTAPYGAHTTASDALWMGVPLLTASGRSFASRVCGSLVRAAGLPDLDCASFDEFVDRAVAMGRDRAILQRYREKLAAERDRSVLFDTPLLVARLEAIFQGMWEDFLAGRLPVPDLSNLDIYLEIGSAIDHEEREVQAVPDYRRWWRDKLAAHHALRPIRADKRLWKRKRRE